MMGVYLWGGTLELQQHHGAGTLHDVKVEQQRLVSVTADTYTEQSVEDMCISINISPVLETTHSCGVPACPQNCPRLSVG